MPKKILLQRKMFILILVLTLFFCDAQSNLKEPQNNFNALFHLLDKNYASFKEKDIDWLLKCEEFRKRVSPNTSGSELFKIMIEMLKPLKDAHVTIRAREIDRFFSASRESQIINELRSIPKEKRIQSFKKMTENTLTQNGFEPIIEIGPRFRNEKLFGYTKSSTIGYLRFFRCFSSSLTMNGFSLNKQLSKIFDSFRI